MGRRPTRGGAAGKPRQKEKDESLWGWVLSEVSDPSNITREHILQAYGFSKRNTTTKPVCPNTTLANKATSVDDMNVGDKSAQLKVDPDAVLPVDVERNGIGEVTHSASCSKSLCTNNPNCLNYVDPDILRDEATAWEAYLDVSNIGDNPSDGIRDVENGQPVGLRNLGATCYVNAYLQVWFRNKRFVQAVMQCSSDDPRFPKTPIHHLQVTFAAMQGAKLSVYDPSPLVESLALNPSEQQDALEFSKLLLSLIGDEFKKQREMGLQSFIGREFEGTQTYGVECNACGTRSERPSEFLELEINLQGPDTLENSLRTLLQDELLAGTNKYFCGKCEKLQNARRYSKLSKLPPVLQFGIMRFQYDAASDSRKKKSHTLSIPTVLDMTPFIDTTTVSTTETEEMLKGKSMYRLQAILCHKGTSAYRGHYEAQLLDSQSNLWTNFNDEAVTFVGPRAGGASVKEKVKGKQGQMKNGMKSSNEAEYEAPNPASANGASLPKSVESKDAYMLVYRNLDTEHSPNAELYSELAFSNLPPSIANEVDRLNHKFEEEINIYDAKKKATRTKFEGAWKERLGVRSVWRIRSHSEPSIVLPREILEEWLIRGFRKPTPPKAREQPRPSTPPPLGLITSNSTPAIGSTDIGRPQSLNNAETDVAPVSPMEEDEQDSLIPEPQVNTNIEELIVNTDHDINRDMTSTGVESLEEKPFVIDSSSIKCVHGKLDPTKAPAMKRISLIGFGNLTSAIGESAVIDTLSIEDVCAQCIGSIFLERLYAVEHPEKIRQFDENNQLGSAQGIWISKAWLKEWRKQNPKFHAALSGDPSPGEMPWRVHVYCPHGQLEPVGTDRVQISTEAATLLQEVFPQWSPAEHAMEPCAICGESVAASQGRRNEAFGEKSSLKGLPKTTLLLSSLTFGSSYALLPASFLDMWHTWTENPLAVTRPEILDNSSLFCEHGLLKIDTTKEIELKDNGLAIIKFEHWLGLASRYGVAGPVTVTAEDSVDGTVLQASNEICVNCRASQLRNFSSTILTIDIRRRDHASSAPIEGGSSVMDAESETLIYLITEEDPAGVSNRTPEPVQIGAKRPLSKASAAATPSRRSKRLKVLASNHASRLKIEIQRQDTVMDIKQKITNATDMPPIHQRLFLTPYISPLSGSESRATTELTENAMTLEQAGVVAYDKLVVYMPEEAPRMEDSEAGNERDEGSYRAFQGTALTGIPTNSSAMVIQECTTAEEGSSSEVRDADMDGTGTEGNNIAKLSCSACTFDNLPDADRCEVCEAHL